MGDQQNDSALDGLRNDIDLIDAELVRLLEKRVETARRIGEIKGVSGTPFFTPERERQVYDRVVGYSAGTVPPARLQSIFREIMSAARAAETPLQVGYWGPEGTYTHQAAVAAFGHSVQHVPQSNIRDIFLAVERKQTDYGVVPIENSIGGVVPETLDMFSMTNVKICAESFLEVHHHLGSLTTDFSAIKRIYAGPQPSSQCREWLRSHVPQATIVDVVPTAGAVKQALDDPESAAIANEACLQLYGLPSVAQHIEDHSTNRTRFVTIGYNDPAPSGRDKTSLMFKLKNRRGELYKVLGCFVEYDVNLTMIESRPDPRSRLQYIFYVDCGGHRLEQNTMHAINDLRSVASEVVILGSYPSTDEGLAST